MKAFAALEKGKTCFVDIPVPEPGDHEALVKIEACVICNTTDKMVINQHYGVPDFPVIIGHESIGRVVKVGSKVESLKVGDRVTRANAIPPSHNSEYYSAWGGFSEYGIVNDKPAVQGFGDLPLEKAGLLISLSETASCLMQFEPVLGKDVLVIGTGIAGLSLVYFSKEMGARRVICVGRRTERLELAKRLGADEVYLDSSKELEQATPEAMKVDYVFEATGKYDVFKNGIPLLKNNGTCAIYGVPEKPYVINVAKSPANYNQYEFKPQEEMAYDYVCKLLKEDVFLSDIFMTHRWNFDELQYAFEQVATGKVIKGIVVMDLIKDSSKKTPEFVVPHKTATMVDDRYNVTEDENSKIIQKYFTQGSDGPLKTFDMKEKNKLVVLKQIAKRFEFNNFYSEKQINEIIKTIYPDFATIRRYLIEYGFMERKTDGSQYWLKEEQI
ncbi:MAG TPA: DUF2087 domain-containing protein [Ruminiclostridium sp.]